MRLFLQIFVYLLLVLSGLYSCKSTKTISESSEQSQTHIRSADSAVSHLQLREFEHTLMNELVSEGWDVEFKIFLPPDSNGLQSLKMEGKAKQNKRVQHEEQRIRNKEETAKANSKHIQNIASNRETKDKAENFKFSEPNYVMRYVVYILYAIIAFTLIYILRKWLR